MPMPTCCDTPKPIWTARRAEGGYSDSQICGACGTVLASSTFKIPVRLPTQDRCVNCSADLEPNTELEGDDQPVAFHCDRCLLSDAESMAQHQAWAAAVAPRMPEAALALMDSGRMVLALKVATAVLRTDRDQLEANAVRLQCLESLGYGESATAEARDWVKRVTAPEEAWSILATLESSHGDVPGALRALQRYLRMRPTDTATWVEYAELLLHTEDRHNALSAASHALADEDQRPQVLRLMTDIANRYVQDHDLEGATHTFESAGDFSLSHPPLLFARASSAALTGDLDKAVHWLERTLEHDPDNTDAQEALQRIKPKERKPRWKLW